VIERYGAPWSVTQLGARTDTASGPGAGERTDSALEDEELADYLHWRVQRGILLRRSTTWPHEPATTTPTSTATRRSSRAVASSSGERAGAGAGRAGSSLLGGFPCSMTARLPRCAAAASGPHRAAAAKLECAVSHRPLHVAARRRGVAHAARRGAGRRNPGIEQDQRATSAPPRAGRRPPRCHAPDD